MKYLLSKKKKGFTLIELLVVVSIIVILIVVGVYSYGNTKMKARDFKRKTDIQAVQTALQLFYNSNNSNYPNETSMDRLMCTYAGDDNSNFLNWGAPFTCSGTTYMSKLPEDPTGNHWNCPGNNNCGRGYIYEIRETSLLPAWCISGGGQCKKYSLWARLENPNDQDKWVAGNGTSCDEALLDPLDKAWYDPAATWYCVTEPN